MKSAYFHHGLRLVTPAFFMKKRVCSPICGLAIDGASGTAAKGSAPPPFTLSGPAPLCS